MKKKSSKNLHIIYFVDSTKTNTLTVPLAFIQVSLSLSVMAMMGLAYLGYRAWAQKNTIEDQRSYIFELKSTALHAYANPAFASEANAPQLVAQAQTETRPLESQSNSSMTEKNAEASTVELSASNAASNHSEGSTLDTKSKPFSVEKVRLILSGRDTRASFQLVNSSPTEALLAGKVCLVGETRKKSLVGYPNEWTQSAKGSVNTACSGGLPIKFRLLRPTDLVLKDVSPQDLERLSLVFTHGPNKQTDRLVIWNSSN